MRKLRRPRIAPRRIPLWAWHMDAWIRSGRRGPRPSRAPHRLPLWFHPWRLFILARARGKGSRAWKRYMRYVHSLPDPQGHLDALRQTMVANLRWGIAHKAEIDYTQGIERDDYLTKPPRALPMHTDCSGDVTWDSWISGGPDPSGFAFRWVGWTGSILAFAYKHGRVFTDVSKALPGDDIVIGPDNGWHVVRVLEAGPDPLVSSLGDSSGPNAQRLSVDTREPKRVCQVLVPSN